MISALLFFLSHVSSQAVYPPGCSEATFPNSEECIAKDFSLGADAKDSCAPIGPYPVSVRRNKIESTSCRCRAFNPSISFLLLTSYFFHQFINL